MERLQEAVRKSELSITTEKLLAEDKPFTSPISSGGASGRSNLAEMVDALSRPQQTVTPIVSPSSPNEGFVFATASTPSSRIATSSILPTSSLSPSTGSISLVDAGLPRSSPSSPSGETKSVLQQGSPFAASSTTESPGGFTKTQRQWEQDADVTDKKQAELASMQWNLFKDQLSSFSQDLMGIRAELRGVVGKQAELRHMLMVEETQRQEFSTKTDTALKNVQNQAEATSRTLQTEVADRREIKDKALRDVSFLEERLEKATQDFRSNHSILTQTLDRERQERVQGEERRDERMRASTSDLQRSFDGEVNRIQQLFEEAERKRTVVSGQLSSEVQAASAKLDDLVHEKTTTEAALRKSIQEAGDRLRGEVDTVAQSLRNTISDESTKRKAETTGMNESLQRLRTELDRETADRIKGDEQTSVLLSQLRTELAEGNRSRREGEKAISRAAGDEEITKQLREARQLIEQEVKDRQAGEEQSAKRLQELSSTLEDEHKDLESIRQRLQACQEQVEGENAGTSQLQKSLEALQRATGDQFRQLRQDFEGQHRQFRQDFEGQHTEQATELGGRLKALAEAVDSEVKERTAGHEIVMKLTNEHRELAMKDSHEHRTANVDLKLRCESLAASHELGKGELQALATAHEQGMSELQALSEVQERAMQERSKEKDAQGALDQNIQLLMNAKERSRAEMEGLAAAHEHLRGDVQALSSAHVRTQEETLERIARLKEEVQTDGKQRQEELLARVAQIKDEVQTDGKPRADEATLRKGWTSDLEAGIETLREALDQEVHARAALHEEVLSGFKRNKETLEKEIGVRASSITDLVERVDALSIELSAEVQKRDLQRPTQQLSKDSPHKSQESPKATTSAMRREINELKRSLKAELTEVIEAEGAERKRFADQILEQVHGSSARDHQVSIEELKRGLATLRQALEEEVKERQDGDQVIAKQQKEVKLVPVQAKPPSPKKDGSIEVSDQLEEWKASISEEIQMAQSSNGEAMRLERQARELTEKDLYEALRRLAEAMSAVERGLTQEVDCRVKAIEDESGARKAALQVEASHRAQGDSDARSKVAEMIEEVKTCRSLVEEERRLRIETSEVMQETWKAQHDDEVHARVVATVSLKQDIEELRGGYPSDDKPQTEGDSEVRSNPDLREILVLLDKERQARESSEKGLAATISELSEKLGTAEVDTLRLTNEAKKCFEQEAEHLWQALDSHTHDVDIGATNPPAGSTPDPKKPGVPGKYPEDLASVSVTSESPRPPFTAVVKRASMTPQSARPTRGSSPAHSARQPSASPLPSPLPSSKDVRPGTTIYQGMNSSSSKRSVSQSQSETNVSPSLTADNGGASISFTEDPPSELPPSELPPSADTLGDTMSRFSAEGLTVPGSPRSIPVTPKPKDFHRLQQILNTHGPRGQLPSQSTPEANSRPTSQSKRTGPSGYPTSGYVPPNSSRPPPTQSRDKLHSSDHSAPSSSRSLANGDLPKASGSMHAPVAGPASGTPALGPPVGGVASASAPVLMGSGAGSAHSVRQPPRASGSPPPQKQAVIASPPGQRRSGSLRVSPPAGHVGVTATPSVRMMVGNVLAEHRPGLSNAGPGRGAPVVHVGAGTPQFSPAVQLRGERERSSNSKPAAQCLPAQYGRAPRADPSPMRTAQHSGR